MEVRFFSITTAWWLLILAVVPGFHAEAGAAEGEGLRCVDIVEGLGRMQQPDPTRAFEIALDVLSETSVFRLYPRLNRVRDVLASLPEGYRSLPRGAIVLAAEDRCDSKQVGQAMGAQETSMRLGRMPAAGSCRSSWGWMLRMKLEIQIRQLSTHFPVARFDVASMFERFNQRLEQGLKEGELHVEGFVYADWQVEFILIRLNGVDTLLSLKIPRE